MILRVTKLGEDVLRQKALPVEEVNDEIKQLVDDMFETMYEYDGIGLAGPQVDKKLRLFVIDIGDNVRRAFINPQIIKTSAEVGEYDEGCLSIPNVYETITRPVAITVQALNEKGKPFTIDADGLLARAIQHEYDHLDGFLYIDRGDADFAKITEDQFKKKAERAAEKAKAKEAKARKIAAKQAAKAGKNCQ